MKPIKYIAAVVIAAAVFSALYSCSGDNGGEITEVYADATPPSDAVYKVGASDVAAVGSRLFYLRGGDVYDTDNRLIFDGDAKRLAASEDTLFVFGGGEVYAIKMDAPPPVSGDANEDGDAADDAPAEIDATYRIGQYDVESAAYADGTLCWSCVDGGKPKLGFYSLETGDSITVDPIFGVECRVMPAGGPAILVLCFDMSGEMYLYDFDTATMKAGNLLVREQLYNAAYNAADNSVYTFDGRVAGSRVKRYDAATLQSQSTAVCDELRANFSKVIFANGAAVILNTSGDICVRGEFSLTDDALTTVTVIADHTANMTVLDRLESLTETLLSEYGIELVIKKLDADKLAQKQLAGDGDFDLYFTNNRNLVLEYPVYETLDGYPAIIEGFDAMFDDVRRLCTYDGRIFGISVGIPMNNAVSTYNAGLLDKLELELPPAGWGIKEFYELGVYLRERGCYISPYLPLWMNSYAWVYFDTYGTGKLLDDGEALRELMYYTKKIEDEGILYTEESGDSPESVLFNGDAVTDIAASSRKKAAFVWRKSDVWYDPTLNGTPFTDIITFIQMNVNSQNKNAAAAVLAEYMKPTENDLDPRLGAMLYKDMSRYKLAENFVSYIEKGHGSPVDLAEYALSRDLSDMDEKTALNFGIFMNILSGMKVNRSYNEWVDFAVEQSQKYYDDEQDLDYTVELLVNRARLMLGE